MGVVYDFYDWNRGCKLRDAGMDRVLLKNPVFLKRYYETIEALPNLWTGLNEDIRADWKWAPPTHHNAWGAAWNGAIRKGLITKIEVVIPMRRPSSHARRTFVYQRIWRW